MRELIDAVEKAVGILERRSVALLADAEDLREAVGKAKRKLYEEAKANHRRCPKSHTSIVYGRRPCIHSEYHPGCCVYESRYVHVLSMTEGF